MKLYSDSRNIERLEDCYFYHTIDLPGIGTIKGDWDLRRGIDQYLGDVDFGGKRVLDVGCANGMLSFHMESKGAKVVSYDLDKTGDWDMVPFAKWKDYQHISNERKTVIDRLNNAYWYSHRVLESKANVVYGSVYAIPSEIETVDTAVFGSILLHLRDPFGALQSGLRLTKETVIVTEVLRNHKIKTNCRMFFKHPINALRVFVQSIKSDPSLVFMPDATTMDYKDVWWDIRPEWTVQALGVLGFENTAVSYHSQLYEGRETELYTVVGRRTHGIPA